MSEYEDETPEEREAQIEEWREFAKTDLAEAIALGYLDGELGRIAAACALRRAEANAPIEKRTRSRSTAPDLDEESDATGNYNSPAPLPATGGTQVGVTVHPPGRALPEQPEGYGRYSGTHTVERTGKVYRKHDIQVCGQRFVVFGTSNQWDGLVCRVVKVNRSRALCEVIDSEWTGGKNRIGEKVNVPLDTLVRYINKYNEKYGVIA